MPKIILSGHAGPTMPSYRNTAEKNRTAESGSFRTGAAAIRRIASARNDNETCCEPASALRVAQVAATTGIGTWVSAFRCASGRASPMLLGVTQWKKTALAGAVHYSPFTSCAASGNLTEALCPSIHSNLLFAGTSFQFCSMPDGQRTRTRSTTFTPPRPKTSCF